MTTLTASEKLKKELILKKNLCIVIEAKRHQLDNEKKDELYGVRSEDVNIIQKMNDNIYHVLVSGKEYVVNTTPEKESLKPFNEDKVEATSFATVGAT